MFGPISLTIHKSSLITTLWLRFLYRVKNTHGVEVTLGVGLTESFMTIFWLSKFPNLSLKGLSKYFSDHRPILIHEACLQDWGTKPFRSLDVWFTDKSFKPLVVAELDKMQGLPIHYKLKQIKAHIKY